LVLSSCGFTPLYGTQSGASFGNEDLLDYVTIDNIPNREGQYLRNALIDRFYRHGRPANPQYTLSLINLETRRTDLDITKTSSTTREQVRLKADMILTDKLTGETLLERRVSSTASYNVLESEFTTRISRKEAQDNALLGLADQVEAQLTLYFQRNLKASQKTAP
jgi:LPS-assembly lipoprotein